VIVSIYLMPYSQDGTVPKPDEAVTRAENQTEAAIKKLLASPAGRKLDPWLPPRPGFGTRGRPVVLWANHFSVASVVSQVLYRYHIDVTSAKGKTAPTGKKLKRIIELFLDQHLPQHHLGVVTNFKSYLLAKTEVEMEMGKATYQVTYFSEDSDEPTPYALVYDITLKETGTINVPDLMNHLASTQPSHIFSTKEETIQALQILIGHHPKAARTIASVGANKHFEPSSHEIHPLGAGLVAIQGFLVSVRAATARLLVNVQIKNMAFFNPIRLDRLMQEFIWSNGNSVAKMGSFLKRLSIEVVHIQRKNKAGKSVARIKTILSLARRDDGRGQVNPPIVSKVGGGSKEVKFFLLDKPAESSAAQSTAPKSQGKGKKGKPPPTGTAEAGPGKYISVHDFFKQGKTSLSPSGLVGDGTFS
jgi:eukaryotic translation initiation factor 2C